MGTRMESRSVSLSLSGPGQSRIGQSETADQSRLGQSGPPPEYSVVAKNSGNKRRCRCQEIERSWSMNLRTPFLRVKRSKGKQMKEGFTFERTRRQDDFERESQKRRDDQMEHTMTAKMEDIFKRPNNKLKIGPQKTRDHVFVEMKYYTKTSRPRTQMDSRVITSAKNQSWNRALHRGE